MTEGRQVLSSQALAQLEYKHAMDWGHKQLESVLELPAALKWAMGG
jgi:hypothetical protein